MFLHHISEETRNMVCFMQVNLTGQNRQKWKIIGAGTENKSRK